MKRYKFESPDDVRDFIEQMVEEDVIFHLDDDPEEIFKGELGYVLKLNMIDLWKYCDPWQVLEFYPETERKYMQREEI